MADENKAVLTVETRDASSGILERIFALFQSGSEKAAASQETIAAATNTANEALAKQQAELERLNALFAENHAMVAQFERALSVGAMRTPAERAALESDYQESIMRGGTIAGQMQGVRQNIAGIQGAQAAQAAQAAGAIAAMNAAAAASPGLLAQIGNAGGAALGLVRQGAGAAMNALQSMGNMVGNAVSSLFSLKALFIEMAADELVHWLFKANAQFQTQDLLLRTLFGNAKDAHAAMMGLIDVETKMPFTLANITDAYIRLVGMGLAPTKAQLVSLADVAVMAHTSIEQMAINIERAATGRVAPLNLKLVQMQASIQKIPGDLEHLDVSFKGVHETIDRNAQSIEDWLLKIAKLPGVVGAASGQMETLGGQLTNLKTAFFKLALAIGDDGTNDSMGGALRTLTQKVNELTFWFQTHGVTVERWGAAVVGVFRVVAGSFAIVWDAAKGIGDVVMFVLHGIETIALGIASTFAHVVNTVLSGVDKIRAGAEWLSTTSVGRAMGMAPTPGGFQPLARMDEQGIDAAFAAAKHATAGDSQGIVDRARDVIKDSEHLADVMADAKTRQDILRIREKAEAKKFAQQESFDAEHDDLPTPPPWAKRPSEDDAGDPKAAKAAARAAKAEAAAQLKDYADDVKALADKYAAMEKGDKAHTAALQEQHRIEREIHALDKQIEKENAVVPKDEGDREEHAQRMEDFALRRKDLIDKLTDAIAKENAAEAAGEHQAVAFSAEDEKRAQALLATLKAEYDASVAKLTNLRAQHATEVQIAAELERQRKLKLDIDKLAAAAHATETREAHDAAAKEAKDRAGDAPTAKGEPSLSERIRGVLTAGKTANAELLTLKATLNDLTVSTVGGFVSALQAGFEAMTSGAGSAGAAFKKALGGAIASVAKQKGDLYFAESIADAAELNFGAAASHLAAAGLMYALAGAASGAASGGGGSGSGSASASRQSSLDAANGNGTAVIVVEGDSIDVSDPRQLKRWVDALEKVGDRRVVVRTRDGRVAFANRGP